MTIYVPLLLAVETDDLGEAQEAARIYTGESMAGESTKLIACVDAIPEDEDTNFPGLSFTLPPRGKVDFTEDDDFGQLVQISAG